MALQMLITLVRMALLTTQNNMVVRNPEAIADIIV